MLGGWVRSILAAVQRFDPQPERVNRPGGTTARGSASVALLLLVAMHVVSSGTIAAAAGVGARLEVTAERLVYGRYAARVSCWRESREGGRIRSATVVDWSGVVPSGLAFVALPIELAGPMHLDLPPPLS